MTDKPDRKAWLILLEETLTQIADWAESANWQIASSPKTIREPKLGTYKTRMVRIRTPYNALSVIPVGREIAGADGRIDIESWPEMSRVVLLRRSGRWVFRDDNGRVLRLQFNARSFLRVAQALARDVA